MFAAASNAGSKVVTKMLRQRAKSRRSYSSSSTPPKAKRSLFGIRGKLTLAALTLGAGLFVADAIMNDEVDTVFTDRFREHLSDEQKSDRPNVVILGTGWGSLSMLRKLHKDKFNVTIVSPRNYFLFTPLLPSTTSGLLEVRSIMEPIRKYTMREDKQEATFVEMEATKIDFANNKVVCEDKSAVTGAVAKIEVPYDYLIVSVGADTATFNIPGVKENAIYMKSIQDSRRIRDSIMDCFETASIPGQPEDEISRLLHFIVVGGGPSGVEYTAELYDFVHSDLKKSFPKVADRVKISLVEALPTILPMFDKKLVEYTEQKFTNTRSIEVWTKSAVTQVQPKALTVKKVETGELLNVPYGTLVWVTGNTPAPLIKDAITTLGPTNQPIPRGLNVDEHLLVKGTSNVFALGDCSICGRLPATAQVASQEGRYLGRLFNQYADLMHQSTKAAHAAGIAASNTFEKIFNDSNKFVFHNLGSLAYIGQSEAIADFGSEHGQYSGVATWLLWRSVYMSKLLSFRNRVFVASDWLRTSIFGRDISRG